MSDIEGPPRTRKTKAQRWSELHATARSQFDAIWSVVGKDREQALADRRFATVRGAQWQGQFITTDSSSDAETGVPRMEINKVGRSKRRLLSEYRQNRVTVDFKPKEADKATADNLDGLYRADENDSRGGGQDAYDNAFDEANGGGFGAWRLRARYEDEGDEDNDHQRISIEPIYDADQSVFFDIDAKHQDKSDARHGFLLFTMSRAAFEDKYPKHDPATFTQLGAYWGEGYEWTAADTITLAEYFVVEDHGVLRRTFRSSIEQDEDGSFKEQAFDDEQLTDEKLEELDATGWDEVRSRKVKRQRVRKYVMSGAEILIDEGYIAGPNIPIVPLYKERCFIAGVEKFTGHVGPLTDPQIIYNTLVSSLTEASAASPIPRPVFDPEQVQGLEDSWARANLERHPYSLARVLYSPDGQPIAQGPVAILNPPTLAPNVQALIQLAGQDLAELSGDSEQVEDVPANTSAQAIQLVTDKVDSRSFLELDNMRKAMKRSGEVWLGMAQELYVEEGREMPILDPEGGQGTIKLAEPVGDEKSGERVRRNDFTTGKYEVIVDVGPASRTRKDATVRNLFGAAQTAATMGDMETAAACLTTAITNMDGEGIDGIQKWLRRRGVVAGYIEPTDEEAAELEQARANQQPDPQQQLVMAATNQAEAEAEKARAATGKTVADTGLVEAKIVETLAGIEQGQRDQILEEVRMALEQRRHEDGIAAQRQVEVSTAQEEAHG